MSFGALVAKELGDLVRKRRLLYFLLAVTVIVTIGFVVLTSVQTTPDPKTYIDVFRFLGPLFVGFLALTLAGDVVARERQDRTIDLLFTAPVTKGRWFGSTVLGHLVGFGAFALLVLLFAATVGALAGWVALPLAAIYIVFILLPIFVLLDLTFLGLSTRFGSGRPALVVAAFVVLGLWLSSQTGPFFWAFRGIDWWPWVSYWHPFDAGARIADGIVEDAAIHVAETGKILALSVLAAIGAFLGFRALEVGS